MAVVMNAVVMNAVVMNAVVMNAVVYTSYSLRMEGEAIKESIVHGHHIYKEVLRPVTGLSSCAL